MKKFYGLFYLVSIIILIVALLSNHKPSNINIPSSPMEHYIIKYNENRYNTFKKLGPPLGPPLPNYPWPPSI